MVVKDIRKNLLQTTYKAVVNLHFLPAFAVNLFAIIDFGFINQFIQKLLIEFFQDNVLLHDGRKTSGS